MGVRCGALQHSTDASAHPRLQRVIDTLACGAKLRAHRACDPRRRLSTLESQGSAVRRIVGLSGPKKHDFMDLLSRGSAKKLGHDDPTIVKASQGQSITEWCLQAVSGLYCTTEAETLTRGMLTCSLEQHC